MSDVTTRTIHGRGGTRATIILGSASIAAGVGGAVGGLAMIAIDGGSFPDYSQYSAAGVVAGAGIGWVFGALLGSSISEGGRAVGRRMALALWVMAAAAIVTGVVLWTYWRSFVVTKVLLVGELHAIRVATIGSAIAVAVTLVIATRARTRDVDERAPGPVARVIATAGIVALSALFIALLASVYATQRERLDTRTDRAVDAVQRLLGRAGTFAFTHGRYPETQRELMHGTHLSRVPDLEVRGFGETVDGFCVSVALLGWERRERVDDLLATGTIAPNGSATPVDLVDVGEASCLPGPPTTSPSPG